MAFHADVLSAIGRTPLVKLGKVVPAGAATVLVKLEYMNPGGSIKDRMAIHILEKAEKSGLLRKGGTIVENTSGNTGVGLAVAAAVKGYRCIFTIPDKMSKEKQDTLKAFGAQVVVTPTNVPADSPESYYSVAKRIAAETPNSFYVNQYHSADNVEAHYQLTAPEIWEQTGGRIDAFVAASGTGGTVAGVSEYLKSRRAAIRTVLADPPGSALYEYIRHGVVKATGAGSITEGIGIGRVTANMQDAPIDDAVHVEDSETVTHVYRLLREEGLFVSSTSGINVAAAVRVARELGPGHTIVTVLCDTGSKYLSRLFNRDWLRQKGLLQYACP